MTPLPKKHKKTGDFGGNVSITTADIKRLRESTGAGILDCKKALQQSEGDFDEAVEFLRKKGLAAAAKKVGREASEGIVDARVSEDGQTAVMINVNCETDFVARTDDFKNFVDSLIEQLFASNVTNAEELLNTPYVKDAGKTVKETLTEVIAKLGENTLISQAARFTLQGDGMIESYVHLGGRVGVLVEVGGSSRDNEKFAELAHDLALQIAAASPIYLTESDVSAEKIASEKEIYMAQLAEDKKPDNIKERIVEGKLNKWYGDVVLLNQQFVKDSDLTIAKLLDKYSKEIGAPLEIRRFARYELGG